jgi:hypothetical protein
MLADCQIIQCNIVDVLMLVGRDFIAGLLSVLPIADGFLFDLPDGFLVLPMVGAAFEFLGWLNYLVPLSEMARVAATFFIVMNAWGILWVFGFIYQRIPGKLT